MLAIHKQFVTHETGTPIAVLIDIQTFGQIEALLKKNISEEVSIPETKVSPEDFEILNRHADAINQEAQDVLEYQVAL
ncbi:hypothetical protein WDW89_24365 [Deltaproteobacteria bacterium TL4]